MLETKHLTYTVGDIKILKDINLSFSPGMIYAITGPNGGGKTSLAKVLAGTAPQTSGNIILDGKDITKLGITERAKAGIAYGFQVPVRFKGLKVRDLLTLAAGSDCTDQELGKLLAKVGLCAKEYLDRGVDGSLSGGEIKRIEIASVLARKQADVLIMDEPEAGIDIWSFSGLLEVFGQLRQDNKIVIVISHQERILEQADRIIVMAKGEVQQAGSREKLLPQLMEHRQKPEDPQLCDVCMVQGVFS
ncbi:MAG: ATP-binding cassette domain-containing protein [Spirochaetia bacterium]|nr:ATP-binding cassette domain-containing protein [Spirochaetia bacterium]